jgi:RNA polymerase sigma-70 factor, ECF subfamily
MTQATPIPLAASRQESGVCAHEGLNMTEAGFRELYEQTARGLKTYLYRLTGQMALAEDLMQESYYRLMRAEIPRMESGQLKNYLYRIATNLARDHFRAKKFQPEPLAVDVAGPLRSDGVHVSADLENVMAEIKPSDRELMWLAYVEGASHREIATITGLKEASIRPLLFRIRQKLAGLLRERGFESAGVK